MGASSALAERRGSNGQLTQSGPESSCLSESHVRGPMGRGKRALCLRRMVAMQWQPGMTEGNGREAAALRAQDLVVAYIPRRDAKLPVRSDSEERTHAEKLGAPRNGSYRRSRRLHDAEAQGSREGRHAMHTRVELGAEGEDFHNGDEAGQAISTPRHGPRQGEKPQAAAGRLNTQCGFHGSVHRKVRSERAVVG